MHFCNLRLSKSEVVCMHERMNAFLPGVPESTTTPSCNMSKSPQITARSHGSSRTNVLNERNFTAPSAVRADTDVPVPNPSSATLNTGTPQVAGASAVVRPLKNLHLVVNPTDADIMFSLLQLLTVAQIRSRLKELGKLQKVEKQDLVLRAFEKVSKKVSTETYWDKEGAVPIRHFVEFPTGKYQPGSSNQILRNFQVLHSDPKIFRLQPLLFSL